MHSLTSSLNYWLKLQSQKIPQCQYAVLVHRAEQSGSEVFAQWPKQDKLLSDEIIEAVSQVFTKQRIHLAQPSADELLVCQPVIWQGEFWGAIIIRLKQADKKAVPGIVKQLQEGLVWLPLLLQSSMATPITQPLQDSISHSATESPATNANHAMPLILQLMQEASLGESCITLVNILATQFQSVRVSLAIVQNKQLVLEAISFSANFDKRTTAMQAIVNAMEEAADQHCDLVYSHRPDAEKPLTKIHRCHQQLVEQNHLTFAYSFLMRVKVAAEQESVLGVVTFEHNQYAAFSTEQENSIRELLNYLAPLFSLKQKAGVGPWQRAKNISNEFLDKRIGKQKHRGKIIAGVLSVLFACLFLPIHYEISSEASLQGEFKNLLVSPQDGFLGTIKARPGDKVKKGDFLAQLNDEDLRLERRKLSSQLQQFQQEFDNALANGNRVQSAIASAKVDQAAAQVNLIEQMLTRTQLISPSDGVVVSDDISQSLGAPVKQGQVLFEIAAASGYLVQLFIDERDIAAIKIGQSGQLKLTSMPGEWLAFSVKAVTPISQMREGRNYFRVEANLAGELSTLRPGMTGTARIDAGTRALGWIWFHEIWHWLLLKIWW